MSFYLCFGGSARCNIGPFPSFFPIFCAMQMANHKLDRSFQGGFLFLVFSLGFFCLNQSYLNCRITEFIE